MWCACTRCGQMSRSSTSRGATHRVTRNAVVECSYGAHPSPVQGYRERDHDFYRDYAEASRTREGFEAWLKRWVLDVPDRASYLTRFG